MVANKFRQVRGIPTRALARGSDAVSTSTGEVKSQHSKSTWNKVAVSPAVPGSANLTARLPFLFRYEARSDGLPVCLVNQLVTSVVVVSEEALRAAGRSKLSTVKVPGGKLASSGVKENCRCAVPKLVRES